MIRDIRAPPIIPSILDFGVSTPTTIGRHINGQGEFVNTGADMQYYYKNQLAVLVGGLGSSADCNGVLEGSSTTAIIVLSRLINRERRQAKEKSTA